MSTSGQTRRTLRSASNLRIHLRAKNAPRPPEPQRCQWWLRLCRHCCRPGKNSRSNRSNMDRCRMRISRWCLRRKCLQRSSLTLKRRDRLKSRTMIWDRRLPHATASPSQTKRARVHKSKKKKRTRKWIKMIRSTMRKELKKNCNSECRISWT